MGVGQFAVILHPPPAPRQDVPMHRQPVEIPQATIAEVLEVAPHPRIPTPLAQPAPPPRSRALTPPPESPQVPVQLEPSRPPQPSVVPRSSAPAKHATSLKRATAPKPYPASKPSGAMKSGSVPKPVKRSNPVEPLRTATPPDVALRRKKALERKAEEEFFAVKDLCDNIDSLRQGTATAHGAPRARQSRTGPKIVSAASCMNLPSLAAAIKSEPEDPVSGEVESSREISDGDIGHLRRYLAKRPAAEFRELCDKLLKRNVSVSPFQLFRAFRQHKVKKRMDNRWFKGDRVTREQFAFNIGEFSYHDLIFIAQFPWDVTYRWAIPGRQRQGWARTQRFMISFALSSDGVEIANVSERLENPDYEGVVDHTMHRTGQSVFILNKHQMEDKDSLNDAFLVWGKQYFFLPPSSPDYDPTKLAKAWIKEEIERRGEELAGDIDMSAARDVVESAVKSITEEQAREWFKQCNYM
ncbi:hypothetical protein FS749_011493 [Ceratobasidium sp. UAMH 11750]|nr:hypothetical protein FS749_011493 [Ceratobasidium sp. UAMH 11750]